MKSQFSGIRESGWMEPLWKTLMWELFCVKIYTVYHLKCLWRWAFIIHNYNIHVFHSFSTLYFHYQGNRSNFQLGKDGRALDVREGVTLRAPRSGRALQVEKVLDSVRKLFPWPCPICGNSSGSIFMIYIFFYNNSTSFFRVIKRNCFPFFFK